MITLTSIAGILALLVVWRMLPPRATGPSAGIGARGQPGCHTGAGRHKLRVATFNIHRGKGADGVRNLDRTAAALAGVDVAGLQECSGSRLPGSGNHASRLARRLRHAWLFAPSHNRWFLRAYGNALLSGEPVGRWTIEPLPGHARHAPRSLLTAVVDIGGEPVTVLVTHLSRESDREQQLALVLERLHRHRRAVLLADLNETRNHPALAASTTGEATDALGVALGDADDERRIDWILVRGLRVNGGGVIDQGASDHPCYWVQLSLH